MYSTYNERKSLVAERFMRALKNKIFRHMTAISKNIYFDVLDDIVQRYNNIVHSPLKWNWLTLRLIFMLNTMKILMKKILISKLVIMLEFKNTKTFLLKDTLKIGQKKIFLLAKLKIQFRWHTWLVTWMVKKSLEAFLKKNCRKLVKKYLE